MTVSQFFDWWDKRRGDERYELVDGEVIAMGRDRIRHNRAKTSTFTALSRAIAKVGVPCEVFIDGVGVSRNTKNFRLPDVVVNCGDVEPDASVVPNPVIVVEIVSPSSEDHDVHIKLAEYFQIPSIAHYLIIYPERRLVIHHRRMEGSETVGASFASRGEIELTPPGISLDVDVLLAEINR
ncbi:MAG TPA: Uma2 family endonuclease [Mesorhizobium sp.]